MHKTATGIRDTMSMKPVHSLFLEGGNAPHQQISNARNDDESAEDYLGRRHEFREKVASQRGTERAEAADVTDVIINLRKVSSKLEIAISACCERVARADDSSPTHRSRLIPVFPANYVVPATPNSLKDKPNKNPTQKATNLGILRSGQSMHFVKLLVMNCPRHEVGHRALAVAILQRTVEWEISSIDHPQLKSSPFDSINAADDDLCIQSTLGLLNTDLKESFNVHAKRTKSFLAAGKH